MGLERLSIDLHRCPRELDDLIRTIGQKQEEAYRIVPDSPAELVWCGDQIGGGIASSPKIFKKYYLPVFERFAEMLRSNGKIFAVDMDGPLLGNIKDEIGQTNIDIVEAFTSPPMGNLSLKEARKAWEDKFIIWMNFPETLFHLGPREVRENTMSLLRDAAPSDWVVMGITEDMPPNSMEEGLRTITRTLSEDTGSIPFQLSRSSLLLYWNSRVCLNQVLWSLLSIEPSRGHQ